MYKNAYPWIDTEEGVLDLHAEWIGTGVFPAQYEEFLFKWFGTTDKKSLIRKLFSSIWLPIWDVDLEKVRLQNRNTGQWRDVPRNWLRPGGK
jgi:hypothetical protein